MSTVHRPKRIAALLAALGIATAGAQPVGGNVEEALPRYHVEIIVFANTEGDPGEEWFAHELARSRGEATDVVARRTPRIVGSIDAPLLGDDGAIVLDSLSLDELVWAAQEQVPDDPNALLEDVLPGAPPDAVDPDAVDQDGVGPAASGEPGAGDDAAAAESTEPPADDLNIRVRSLDRSRAFRFRLLEPDELQLGDEYAHIARLSAYEPLLHGGWVQEGLAEADAYPFDLVYLGTANPRGTIQLHLSRFLHVTLDLDYVAPRSVPDTGNRSFTLGEVSTTPRYALETQRRLRSGELHYIDHPMFGVLVLVTPAPVEPESESGQRQTPAA